MGKSSKHKTQNTYKFVSFAERISNVTVDVIHQIRRTDEEAEGTYFHNAFEKWTELDLTDNFSTFRREISGQVQTFEQLVHNKGAMLKALKTHLAVPNSLALAALLDLVVQLARDLQQDFIPHFKDFFNLLVGVLTSRSQDAEALEQTFQALAYLFKVLWRFLIKDFETIFSYFSHLLGSSQKNYIKVFAAESCAYLMRKVKRQNELLNFLFGSLKISPELADGIGLLLFEMIKGVKHHFHTSAEKMFPLILQSLGPWTLPGIRNYSLPRQLVERAVKVFMQECAEHTRKENCKALWGILLDCISQVHTAILEKQSSEGSEKVSGMVHHLCRMLRLTSVWITHGSGKIVSDADHVASILCVIFKSLCAPDKTGPDLMEIAANLQIMCHETLSVDVIHRINSLIFTSAISLLNQHCYVKALLDLPYFEKDILQGYIDKLHLEFPSLNTEKKEDVLAFVAGLIVHKTTVPLTGEELNMLQLYPLDRMWSKSGKDHTFALYIDSVITGVGDGDEEPSRQEILTLWAAVVCLPHLRIGRCQEKSIALWKHLIEKLKCCNEEGSGDALLTTINQLFRSILTTVLRQKMDAFPFDPEEMYSILRWRPSSPYVLHILDLYLSCPQAADLLTDSSLREIYSLLEQNLASPSHTVRLLTCHILSLFPVQFQDFNDGIARKSVFKIMYEAEKLVPSVHNYREKLIHLRKLEYGLTIRCLPSEFFSKAPLLFLLGNEFWNFKLLWEPLSNIITTHARGPNVEGFWDVMLGQLKKAAQESEKALREISDLDDSNDLSALPALFSHGQAELLADKQSPDFTNYRMQLWWTMKKFPEICVLRSDELCQLFLTFLQNEFNSADEDSRSYQNIISKTGSNPKKNAVDSFDERETDLIKQDIRDDSMDEDEALDVATLSDPARKEKVAKRRRAAIGSLLAHLELFSLFKKHRSKFNQPEVQDTLCSLLMHKNACVQKAAFDCILTYRSPHLLPYRDNFHRLLDDDTFKSEIVLFRVDEESSEVKEVDREGLLPVLMRILYGKLQGKTGKETSGKSCSNLRRSIVFGFLCGCKPEELGCFLELLLQPCSHFVTDDPMKLVQQILSDVNLVKMIPLKRMKGILNTVNTVFKKLGHRLGTSARSLLHILLGITATLNAALEKRHFLSSGVIKLLKTLRHTVLMRLTQFFEYFEGFDYTSAEIEATFQAAVWPQAEKLVLEGVHHPTPLLKLFVLWSHSVRLLPLLGHPKDSETVNVTPLSCVFSLLTAPTLSSSSASTILELVGNLLQSQDEEDESRKRLPLPEPFDFMPGENIGEKLIMPHVSKLLQYLQISLGKLATAFTGKRKQASVPELKILSQVSSFVQSPDECHKLCDLLVPFFSERSGLPQEIEENTLQSLIKLMQHVDAPETFYRTICQLFTSIERRESRLVLCTLFRVVCEKDLVLLRVATLVEKLNAWDKRKTEEPDYLARLEAFTQTNTMMSEMEPSVNTLLPIIYNCCHFIHTVDDLSIRDNSTHCLVSIVTKLTSSSSANDIKVFNIVMEKALLPQVKQGIKHRSEVVRHEFLTVLQSLVIKCPTSQTFSGLSDLCDKDPEADFFENIRHIQIHKRSRALRRLYRHLKDHHFRSEIHLSYFVPLVNTFVLDHTYSKYANIQDAAIDLLGAICKQLPWQHYLHLVKFYLKLLPKKVEMQRQIVRIIVTLLDAFHFDLRNSSYNIKLAPDVVEDSYKEPGEGTPAENEISGNFSGITKPTEGSEVTEDISPMEIDMELAEDSDKTDLTAKQTLATDGKIICSGSAATRIHRTIVVALLPQLHRIITQRAKSDSEHKLVKSKYPEDEEILRVPIALAMIKLLQNLPKETLENRLPGILLKICYFLRSRSREIRTIARETLEKAVLSLGPRFFPFILKEMKVTLTRGYQLHVLSFTTHHLLKGLLKIVSPGDLDPALPSIQDIFYAELFGHVAEEKEVEAIKAKYFEAKFIKGYDAYELLSRCVSPGCLNQLLQPIKAILESTHSQNTANKAETVLRKVADGLMANRNIPIETMMVFVHSLTSRLMSELMGKESITSEKIDQQSRKPTLPESCLLLPQAAPRGGVKPKASKRTNVHVLVEFGLQLLSMCLKHSLLEPTEQSHLQMLDPLVPAIRDCLSNSHVKTSSNAMRCLSWLLRFPLPSLKENIDKVAQGMFVVLQNYTGAGTAKGGNQELISMCFKAVTVLVRDVTYYQVTSDQLQVLLTYCEEDLYNYSRQSSAFNLIRAILSRKLDIPQLHQAIDKVFEMSVTDSSPNVRLQSRQVIFHYLMNYPLGKNLRKHLYFYIDHLESEAEEGRMSVLEMMTSMFSTFPQKILNNHAAKFFVALAMASFNENSVKCRKQVYVALKTLIGKIDVKRRRTLFADVVKWMKSEDLRVCAMSCHICGIFVEVEGAKFELHLKEILPIMQERMHPDCYTNDCEDQNKNEQQDTYLLALMNTTQKIMRELNLARQDKFTETFNQIWGHILSHLSYPHVQIRLASSQLLGLLFSMWEPAEIAALQKKDMAAYSDEVDQNYPFILTNTLEKIRKFAVALCHQLKGSTLDECLAGQLLEIFTQRLVLQFSSAMNSLIVKNLLYIARVTEALGSLEDLSWLTKRVMKEVNMEVIKNVRVSVKRTHVFKWVAAVSVSLKSQSIQSVLPHVLPALLREMTEHAQDQELKSLAQEVLDLLKKQVDIETFTTTFANAQKWRLEKRDVRKRESAAAVVTDPELAARKRIRHNLKKKAAKKRKMEESVPMKRVKKSKLSILNVTVDDN